MDRQYEEEILTPQELNVIRTRFGFGNSKPLGYDAIARSKHLTESEVRELEASALRKLRHGSIGSLEVLERAG